MNRILFCFVALATLTFLSSCATHQNAGPAPAAKAETKHKARTAAKAQAGTALPLACVRPYFRLNMGFNYGPNAPTSPKPVSPDIIWVDVANWQNFLNTHTPYHCTNPPNDVFGPAEMYATWQFQTSNLGGPPLASASACVDSLTFAKAKVAGLANYCTATGAMTQAKYHRHRRVKHKAKPAQN